jgi:hypothetical protein
MRHQLYRVAPFLFAAILAGFLGSDGPIWP